MRLWRVFYYVKGLGRNHIDVGANDPQSAKRHATKLLRKVYPKFDLYGNAVPVGYTYAR